MCSATVTVTFYLYSAVFVGVSASLKKGCDCRLPEVMHMHFFMNKLLFCFFSFLWTRGQTNFCVLTYWTIDFSGLPVCKDTLFSGCQCVVQVSSQNHKYSVHVHNTVSWSVSQQNFVTDIEVGIEGDILHKSYIFMAVEVCATKFLI